MAAAAAVVVTVSLNSDVPIPDSDMAISRYMRETYKYHIKHLSGEGCCRYEEGIILFNSYSAK